MVELLIASYANLHCGFSMACAGMKDLFETLGLGYHFEASESTAKAIPELPFAVYQAAQEIIHVANDSSKVKGLVLVIISNEVIADLSILMACRDILRGIAKKEINVVIHTNIKPGNALSIHLSAAFNELRNEEKTYDVDTVSGIPEFLK